MIDGRDRSWGATKRVLLGGGEAGRASGPIDGRKERSCKGRDGPERCSRELVQGEGRNISQDEVNLIAIENRELQPGRPGLVQRQATLGVTGVFPPEELALPLAPLHSIPFPSFKGLGRFEFKVGRSQGQGEDSGEEEAFSTPAPA